MDFCPALRRVPTDGSSFVLGVAISDISHWNERVSVQNLSCLPSIPFLDKSTFQFPL